jgi:hypothetical protein
MTAVEAEVLGSTLSGYLVDVAIPALVRMADHQAILRTYAPDGSFEDLAPHDMDVIGPILRRMGPAPRFASYLATLDASSPVTSLYDIGFESRQRLGPAGTAKAIARLESTRSEPTVSAVMGLSNATADGAVLAAVRPLLDDPNPHLRKAAVGTLARLGDIGSLDRMVSMIDGDPSRTAACQAALAASMLSPRLSAEQRSRSAAAIIRRHARAVGHERPILRSLAAAFEGPA